MRRGRTLTTTDRSALVRLPPDEVWTTVASAGPGSHWYVDAAPFRFRGGLDRLVGGRSRWPVPDADLLEAGDHAGFWSVVEADHTARRLLLEARVRAPGRVRLLSTVVPATDGAEVRQRISFDPDGVLGAAYLLTDLPARAVVAELTMLHVLTEVRRALGPSS